ncbi:4-alpha-glucanotransferase [Parabacteroides sp. OttesenSCG-928-G07]|nr:4-alpha-glucanotransferase [Parabacteroides sp. OttesenSCG-928-G07]
MIGLFFEEWERKHHAVFDAGLSHYILNDSWQIRLDNMPFYSSAFTQSFFAHPDYIHSPGADSRKKIRLKVLAPRVGRNQTVAMTGNQHCLGNWEPESALLLNCTDFPEWQIDLDAESINFPLEFKFLIRDNDLNTSFSWEAGENRVLELSPVQEGEMVVVSGYIYRDNSALWRTTGTVIPVFSLRSEHSFGVGDLGDLQLMIDWAKSTGQHIIQVLPMNDTTATHTWHDSYPYRAISIYALHPMYVDLRKLGELKDESQRLYFTKKQQELNSKHSVDYEAVNKYKLAYSRAYFDQEGYKDLKSGRFEKFYSENASWLLPYAAYCYLRDKYATPDYNQWGQYAQYNENAIRQLIIGNKAVESEMHFIYFMQYILHFQFKEVSDYARQQGVVLKGDLPIGVNRHSVEAWMEPYYFNMDGQAGAPPDDFSAIGQNWMFPTYNWKRMQEDGFAWWKRRFKKLGDYFDCFRIDHILGFFRIWEIPTAYVQGLCGHFNPALPLTKEDIACYGFIFDENRFTIPRINRRHLGSIFGELADKVERAYLFQSSSEYLMLKPFCNTQQKIEQLFAEKSDDESTRIKQGLYEIANEVLFLRDSVEAYKFHPRISGSQSYLYQDLEQPQKEAFDRLYWDFFYHRHNAFWKDRAYERLTPLVNSTQMLICGEDLGMIPESVPEVMQKLQILSLEIERMPKTANRVFTDLSNLPYLSVCTTSTHDMSPVRSWWKEDKEKTQHYYNDILHRQGEAPDDCSSELAMQIVSNHLSSPSMLTIIPLQDWLAVEDTVKQDDIDAERINIPANPNHYWRYRMHITLEELMRSERLNDKIRSLISASERY